MYVLKGGTHEFFFGGGFLFKDFSEDLNPRTSLSRSVCRCKLIFGYRTLIAFEMGDVLSHDYFLGQKFLST